METDWSATELTIIALFNDSLRVETLDPGQWGGIGEAEVIGEEEDKSLVVGLSVKESRPFFGCVLEVIVVTDLVVAE